MNSMRNVYEITICIPSGMLWYTSVFATAWYFTVFCAQEKPQQSIQAAYDNCPGCIVLTTGISSHALLNMTVCRIAM